MKTRLMQCRAGKFERNISSFKTKQNFFFFYPRGKEFSSSQQLTASCAAAFMVTLAECHTVFFATINFEMHYHLIQRHLFFSQLPLSFCYFHKYLQSEHPFSEYEQGYLCTKKALLPTMLFTILLFKSFIGKEA